MGLPRTFNTLLFSTLISLTLLDPVTVWGSCPDLLTAHRVSSKVYNRIDQAIDHAAQLEARLNEAMAQTRDAKLGESLGELAIEVGELIDKLLDGGPRAIAVSKQLEELTARMDALEAQPMTIDEGEALVQEEGVAAQDEITLDKPLTVYDSHSRPYTVSFTSELIKDFSSRRVSPLVRSRLWHAIHNGLLADGQGRAGIKVMRTSEGIPFVEVKLLKGVAGSARMFGCIKGDQIIMHFIGYDMTSANDPQRVRLKRLCQ